MTLTLTWVRSGAKAGEVLAAQSSATGERYVISVRGRRVTIATRRHTWQGIPVLATVREARTVAEEADRHLAETGVPIWRGRPSRPTPARAPVGKRRQVRGAATATRQEDTAAPKRRGRKAGDT